MKKITSFLMMAVLGCASAFAYEAGETVGTELPKDVLVKIGTAQKELVPGQWYFLHNPRNPNTPATAFDVDGVIQAAGGLVTDMGVDTGIKLSATSVIEELTSEEGVSANNYKAHMVRFVSVENEEGAYNIQFGTGNWIEHNDGGNSTNLKSVNNNNYLAGNAGKFNFYLITVEGRPNEAGRFGWNKYNMQNIMDNNGAGGTVVYWNSGEIKAEEMDTYVAEEGDQGIKANKAWQIYDIQVVGVLDKFDEAWNALLEDYTTIVNQQDGSFIDNLKENVNVGENPGNFRPEDVAAFLKLHDEVDEMMYAIEMNGMDVLYEKFQSVEELEAYNEEYVKAYNHMVTNKVPLAAPNIAPGFYTLNSMLNWYETKVDTVFYTQEEADSVNAEMGYTDTDEGFVTTQSVKETVSSQVAAPIKALKSHDSAGEGWVAWMNLAPTAEFLWKIESVEGQPTKYRLINMYRGHSFTGIGQSGNSKLVANDTATVCFDYRGEGVAPVSGEKVIAYNIRASQHAENGYNYIHAGGHNSGAGKNGWAVGWADGGATQWYLAPVDAATADQWLNGPEAQLKAQIKKADSIVDAFPAQLKIAIDLVGPMTDKPIASAENFYSPYHCPAEGNIAQLFDGTYNNTGNFWHSNWQSGNGYGYSTTTGTNYFVVEDINNDINGALIVKVARRPVANDHLTELTVYGTNDAYVFEDDLANVVAGGEDIYEWTELGVLSTPYGSGSEFITSNAIEFEGQYKFYKFVATKTSTNRGYFHMGEFQLYPVSNEKLYPTTQYDVRKAEADALQAAIDAWVAGEYTADDVAILDDEAYKAAYSALIAAAEAWGAVYVDPTALRTAIAGAPAANLFVTGNNPGQWKEGVATPTSVVAEAEAYNASGSYTAAKSQEWIDAIASAIENVYKNANSVEEGKWYRIKFPTEEMYETYGWDKSGAQAVLHSKAEGVVVSPELFGKKLAAGRSILTYVPYTDANGVEQFANQYTVEATDENFAGDGVFFFDNDEEFENGEDLFRFIKATDSTFMLQNKATGLFVRSTVALEAIPTYFQQTAIGAGANLLYTANIFGGQDTGYGYLHGQRADNRLVTWASTNLGSNSMLMIEEVEAVAEAPATEYVAKLWPGKVYTYTMPVDVKVVDGATAYAASLELNENDTTVVLKNLDAIETISSGTPFILISDFEGEYETSAAMLARLQAEKREELGVQSLNQVAMQQCQQAVEDNYAYVTMDHGMVVDTLVHDVLGLKGTMKSFNVAAGKAVVAKENGFAHTLVQTSIAPFSAYFATDFDPESADVVGKIYISISEDGVDTGINEVLNKVAQNGNIYNAAGQLVGKGNINTINNLPAGIYVVNGVKVTKK